MTEIQYLCFPLGVLLFLTYFFNNCRTLPWDIMSQPLCVVELFFKKNGKENNFIKPVYSVFKTAPLVQYSFWCILSIVLLCSSFHGWLWCPCENRSCHFNFHCRPVVCQLQFQTFLFFFNFTLSSKFYILVVEYPLKIAQTAVKPFGFNG